MSDRGLMPAIGAWCRQVPEDVRVAWRAIRRSPAVSAVVIASIGLGIGVNTAVFSWLQTLLLKPIPGVRDASAFHAVEPLTETGSYPGSSWLEYQDLSERLPSFSHLVASRMAPFSLGAADWSERTYGQFVSGNYFTALGLGPALGRFFGPEDSARPGASPVVVISHGLWQARFGGHSSVVGQTIRVNDRPMTLVGVAPEGFQGTTLGVNFDLWVPATMAPALIDGSRELENRGQRGYSIIGRLRREASAAGARREFAAAMQELARTYPDSNRTMTGEVLPFWRSARGPQRFMMGALAALQAAMLLVLLVVCANTANLVLARASARARETAVRLAVGAGRWRVVNLVLTESLMLSMAGSALGAAIAMWATNAMRAVPFPTPAGIQIRYQTDIDLVGLAFAMALGVMAGLVFGLPPALQLARVEPQQTLRAGTNSLGRSRARDSIMAVEVALALVVLVVAATFLKRDSLTRSTDPGFQRDGVLLAAYDLRGRTVNVAPQSSVDFAARLLEQLRSVPAVESAAIAASVPLDIHGFGARSFRLEGRARDDGAVDQALTNVVTPGYFATMRIPLVAGQDFAELGDPEAPAQAIVNQEFVRRYLSGMEPLGRRLESAGRDFTIAGIAKDSRYDSFDEPPTPFIYLSYRDRPSPLGEIHVRTRPGQELTLANEVRRVLRDLNPSLALYNVRTLGDHVERNLVFERIPARMFAVLGPLLLALAAIGIYAVVAYGVARRRVEIGTRMALGATAPRVVWQLIAETLRVVATGLAAGWVVAFAIDREVVRADALDPVVFAGVPLLLTAVAAAACWLPARRASQVDPNLSLRQE